MISNNIIFLASSSASRQALLKQMGIAFEVIKHDADESQCTLNQSFDQLLKDLACLKMKHAHIPPVQEKVIFVLTADTLSTDKNGVIHGKPVSKADAIEKIKVLRAGGTVATAFCLDKKQLINAQWHTQERICEIVHATYELDMPDAWINRYLTVVSDYMNMSGALSLDGYGAQFVKFIQGSYTTILGLPLCALRQALEKMEFYD